MKLSFLLAMLSISMSTLAEAPCTAAGPVPATLSTHAGRADYAKSLLRANEVLNKAVPELSPREEEWLKQEWSAGGRRQGNAFMSAEYSISLAKSHASLRSRLILPVSKRETMPIAVEMQYWSRIASSYLDSAFAQAVAQLVEKKVIDPSFLGSAPPGLPMSGSELERFLDVSCQLHGEAILEHIIIPYLDGRLSE